MRSKLIPHLVAAFVLTVPVLVSSTADARPRPVHSRPDHVVVVHTASDARADLRDAERRLRAVRQDLRTFDDRQIEDLLRRAEARLDEADHLVRGRGPLDDFHRELRRADDLVHQALARADHIRRDLARQDERITRILAQVERDAASWRDHSVDSLLRRARGSLEDARRAAHRDDVRRAERELAEADRLVEDARVRIAELDRRHRDERLAREFDREYRALDSLAWDLGVQARWDRNARAEAMVSVAEGHIEAADAFRNARNLRAAMDQLALARNHLDRAAALLDGRHPPRVDTQPPVAPDRPDRPNRPRRRV